MMTDWISLARNKFLFIKVNKDEISLFGFFAVYLISWSLLAAFLPLSAELDSVEQVVWSQTWQWGYYKHPPLPSALLHVLNFLFGGPSMGLIAFAAQGCNVVALIYVWLLAKQMLPRKSAIIAVLITSLIAYYHFKALTFNHDTVSSPFTAAALYYFYCALRCPERTSTWLWLGFVSGLAMLTKYSALLIFAGFFVYLTWQRLWTDTRVIRGIFISSMVFALMLFPHIVWLVEHNWLPLTYIHNKLSFSQSRLVVFENFFIKQIFRLSFTLPLLLGVWYQSRKGAIRIATDNSSGSPKVDHDLRFLLIVLLTPLILAMMPTLLTGSPLADNWVSAFFLPAGILAAKCFFNGLDETQLLKTASRLAWVTHGAILIVFFWLSAIHPVSIDRAARFNFPSRALAEKVTEIWHRHRKEPLAIVISNYLSGGHVLLHTRPEPTLLIDNKTERSPWVSEQDVAACGAFILVKINQARYYSDLLSHAVTKGEFLLTWRYGPREKDLHYLWGILPPLLNNGVCRFHASGESGAH